MAVNPPQQAQQGLWQRARTRYGNLSPSWQRIALGIGGAALLVTLYTGTVIANRGYRFAARQVGAATELAQSGVEAVKGSFGYETDIWGKCLPVAGVVKDAYALENMKQLPLKLPHVPVELKHKNRKVFAALEYKGSVTRPRFFGLGRYQIDLADARREEFEQGRIGCVVPYRTSWDMDIGDGRYILLPPGLHFERGR